MLERLGKAVVRRARLVLIITAIAFVVAGALGAGVQKHLKTGGYNDPKSGSVVAADALTHQFHAGTGNIMLVVHPTSGSLDDPAAAQAGKALTARFAAEQDMTDVASYW